jgi:serine/threonine-protein kinase
MLMDRQGGRVTPLRDSVGTRPRFSPDGRFIVAEDSGQVWIHDLARGGTRSLFSTRGLSFVPIWRSDGSRIVSSTYDGGPAQLWSFSVNNPNDVRRLAPSPRRRYATSFTPDGRIMAFGSETSQGTRRDIWLLEGDSARPWLNDSHNEFQPRISPDGRWLAYTSNESGQQEIYVRSVTGKGSTRVSTNGGSFSRWRKDGRELFYRSLDGSLMSVSVASAGDGLKFGAPVSLLPIVEPLGTFAYPYDVAPDGQKILALTPSSTDAAPLMVIVNWEAGLRK